MADDPEKLTPEKLTPEKVRAIRERLGLSQAEAGELLGGGPRAFAKYEAGVIEPAASLITLLKLLDMNPHLLEAMGKKKSINVPRGELGPFEVSDRHISELKARQSTALLRRLISAEAAAADISADRIHVPHNPDVPDGGEDGVISWIGDPDRTEFLPAQTTQFQLKAGRMTPAMVGAELLDRDGNIKSAIRQTLQRGGSYVMMCFQPYVGVEVRRREERMQEVFKEHGLDVSADRVIFRDATLIAIWANKYPSVVTWVLEQTQPKALGPFRTWKHWADRPENEGTPFVADARLEPLSVKVRETAQKVRGVLRVVGNSGVGKSRLVLEALGPTEVEERSGTSLSALVVYGVEDEFGPVAIRAAVQGLVDAETRAIVVVDRCTLETHRIITNMVRRAGSRVSLITIDDVVPPGEEQGDCSVTVKSGPAREGDLLIVGPSSSAVVEAIIKQSGTKIRGDDRRRLVDLAGGYPIIAVQVARNYAADPSSVMSDDELVDRVILGRSPADPEGIRRAAMIISAFDSVGYRAPADRELVTLAKAKLGLDEEKLRAAIAHLLRRGAAQQRGHHISIKPHPIALNLAHRQWEVWSHKQWEKVLTDRELSGLSVRAAKQLSYLNTTPKARDVVRVVCRRGGGLERAAATDAQAAEVTCRLAEIDPDTVVALLERAIETTPASEIREQVRRHWVWALERIAFHARTFEPGARLLLMLAQHENETWGNNATGQFKALFPVLGGSTEADGQHRLQFLDEFVDSPDAKIQNLVVEALISGSRSDSMYRQIGAEHQGLRPALSTWRAETWDEVWVYVRDCAHRLIAFAAQDTDAGRKAVAALGRSLRFYVSAKKIDLAEEIVDQVLRERARYWPEAIEGLGHVLTYDKKGLPKEIRQRVQQLLRRMQPEGLIDRAKHLVTEMSWDYPADENISFEARGRRQREAVKSFAAELVREPNTLRQVLPNLARGSQRMSFVFGEAVAELVIQPSKWLKKLTTTYEVIPERERNFELLAGYCVGLFNRDRDCLEAFKIEAANSPVFAPAVPLICWRIGITDRDILLALASLKAGRLATIDFRVWAFGGELAKLPSFAVSPLFDALMIEDETGYWTALELLVMYLHGRMQIADELRPQIINAARLLPYGDDAAFETMRVHHFQTLMKHLLTQEPAQSDARVVAKILSDKLAHSKGIDQADLYGPLLPILLSKFSDIVWPTVGKAILADQEREWFFEHLFGDRFSKAEEGVTLLSLPLETLLAWCHANPETAPPFVGSVLPLLERIEAGNANLILHPTMKRMIDEFGGNEAFLRSLGRNIHTYSWSGSMTTYYLMYKGPLTSLLDHRIPAVRRWARKSLDEIERSIDRERVRDAAWDLGLD